MDAIDRSFFFAQVRERPFNGSMSQAQIDGMTAILDYWEASHPAGDDRWLAYLLGTTIHETARRMQPIHEFGSDERFERLYEGRRSLGNDQPGDGARFHGRGLVQLTGRRNYTDWAGRIDEDLVGNPDLALDLAVATRILIDGSVLGTFTGVRLANYFNESTSDWKNARRVINGNDRDEDIAALAKQFWSAISHGQSGKSGQAAFRPVLRFGARGADVTFLQQHLGITADGDFGARTFDAVVKFQTQKQLMADGIVGLATWAALQAC
jgi:putative chitinase